MTKFVQKQKDLSPLGSPTDCVYLLCVVFTNSNRLEHRQLIEKRAAAVDKNQIARRTAHH